MSDQEIYSKVAKETGIDINKIKAYDKAYWNLVKQSLNNPDFDVLELTQIGTWVVIKSRMRSTLKYNLRILKKTRDKIARLKAENKTITQKRLNEVDMYKDLFKKLWKLKQECNF